MNPGSRGRLVRVDDTDPEALRHLRDEGIGLGVPVELLERRPFEGPYRVRTGEPEQVREHDLGPALAALMWIDSD